MWRVRWNRFVPLLCPRRYAGCQQPTNNLRRQRQGTGPAIHLTLLWILARRERLVSLYWSNHHSILTSSRVFFRISGGLFNPAVTLGLCLIGALPWVRGALLFGTQILGGMAAAGLISCMLPGPLAAETTLGGGTTVTQGVFLEMILTAELVSMGGKISQRIHG